MPSKKSAKVHIVRKRLADGTVKEYRYARTAFRPDPLAPDSVMMLIRAYERSPEFSKLKPQTKANLLRYLRPVALFGHMKVADLKRRHILDMRDEMARIRGHGAAAGFCRATSILCSWAVDRGKMEHSPATRLRGALDAGTLPTWTPEQAERALNGLPEPYRRAVVLALHTGQRRGDLCALRWSAYSGTRIEVEQEKGRRRDREARILSIPVVPLLQAELDSWKREARGLTILETAEGRPWVPGYLSRSLPIYLAKIGLPKGLNIHGLRKLAAVNLANAGCSTHEIKSITGHRTLAMVQHYTEGANQRMLSDSAVVKLAGVNRGKK